MCAAMLWTVMVQVSRVSVRSLLLLLLVDSEGAGNAIGGLQGDSTGGLQHAQAVDVWRRQPNLCMHTLRQ